MAVFEAADRRSGQRRVVPDGEVDPLRRGPVGMLGADLRAELGDDRVGVLAGLPLRRRRACRDRPCSRGPPRGSPTPPTSPWPGTTSPASSSISSVRICAQRAPSMSASFGGNHGKIGKMRSSARSPVKRMRSCRQPDHLVAAGVGAAPGAEFDRAAAEVERRMTARRRRRPARPAPCSRSASATAGPKVRNMPR